MADIVERIIIDVDSSGAVVGARKASAAMGQVGTATTTAGKKAKAAGGVMKTALGLGLVFAAQSAARFGQDSVEAFRVAQQQMRSATTTLDRNVVGWKTHRSEIDATIKKHQDLYKFDDEQLMQSFSRLASSTGSVKRGFDLQNIAMNISRERGISLAAATEKLVKISNGQTRGAKGLGVTFQAVTKNQDALKASTDNATAAQKKAAKAADARLSQEVVLNALRKRFSGQAAAFAKSEAGQAEGAAIAWENAKEDIGKALLPLQVAFRNVFVPVAEFLGNNATLVMRFITGLAALLVVVKGVALAQAAWTSAMMVGRGAMVAANALSSIFITKTVIQTAATEAQAAAQAKLNYAMRANVLGIVITALAALVAGLIYAYKHSETFRRIVDGAFNAVKVAAQAVLNFFRGNWKTIAVLISGPFAPIVALATDAFGIRSALIGAFNRVKDATSEVVGAIVKFFRELPGKVKAALVGLPKAVLGAFTGIASAAFGKAKHIGAEIAKGVVAGIGNIGGAIASKIWEGIKSGISNLGDLPGKVKDLVTKDRAPGQVTSFSTEEENLAVAEMTETKKDDLPILKRMAARNRQRYKTALKRFRQVPKFMRLRNEAVKKLKALVRAKAKPAVIAKQAALVEKYQAAIENRREGLVAAAQDVASASEAVRQATTDVFDEDNPTPDGGDDGGVGGGGGGGDSPNLGSVAPPPAALPPGPTNPGGLPDQMPAEVTVNLEGAMGWLAQFINIEVNGMTTRARTRSLAGGRTY